MKTDSLVAQIINWLADGVWVNGGEIERQAMEQGYKASNASRRLRELYEDGKLEREERPGTIRKTKTVWYRIVPGGVIDI